MVKELNRSGRPRKPENELKKNTNKRIFLYPDPVLFERIKAAAEKDRRTQNDFCLIAVEKFLNDMEGTGKQ